MEKGVFSKFSKSSSAPKEEPSSESSDKAFGSSGCDSAKKSFFGNLAESISSGVGAVASVASSATNSALEGAKSLLPEKKAETRLIFYRGDFLIFEDRLEKGGKKHYFSDVKNLKLEKRLVESAGARVGSTIGRVALSALNGAANGGVVGAVAGGLSGVLDGDGSPASSVDKKTFYLIGVPDRADRDDVVFQTEDVDEANVVLKEINDAFASAGIAPRRWKDGKEVALDENF